MTLRLPKIFPALQQIMTVLDTAQTSLMQKI